MHVLLQYQSKSYYIIGQKVYYSIGRFITLSGSYYIIGRFLLQYRAFITVSGVYYIIGWYRCTLSLPPSLYNCITVDMLFNIVGHTIDGNYESWKFLGQKTERDRLAPGRGPSFPHPGVRRVFLCCSNNAHIFFKFHIFLKQLLTR